MKAFFDNGPLKGQDAEVADGSLEVRAVGVMPGRMAVEIVPWDDKPPFTEPPRLKEYVYRRTDRQFMGATVFTVSE